MIPVARLKGFFSRRHIKFVLSGKSQGRVLGTYEPACSRLTLNLGSTMVVGEPWQITVAHEFVHALLDDDPGRPSRLVCEMVAWIIEGLLENMQIGTAVATAKVLLDRPIGRQYQAELGQSEVDWDLAQALAIAVYHSSDMQELLDIMEWKRKEVKTCC